MRILSCQVILILILTGIIPSAFADGLGRLFTSPVERKQLDKIRHTKEKPRKIEVVEVEEMLEPPAPEIEKEIVVRDAIRLKGIVHRSDGKNSAWINETNTFEGNLESQFIQVPDGNITSDQATIIMPDDSTSVELKVGEVFIPEPIERDVAVDTVNIQDSR